MIQKIIEKDLNKRFEVIMDLSSNSPNTYKTNKDASTALNISIRQIQRLKRKFNGSIDSLRHFNSLRTHKKKFSKDIIDKILLLVRGWNHNLNDSGYSNLLYSHAHQKIMHELNISMSYTFFRTLLVNNNILSNKSNVKIINNKLHLPSKINNTIKHGFEWQADGTFDFTLVGSSLNLCAHVVVDAASNAIVSIFLDYQETNYGYLNAFEMAFKKYGIPRQIATDKRSSFSNNNSTDKRTAMLSRIFDDLDIVSRITSNPRSKNKVESKNFVVKEHIIKELALCNVSTVQEANEVLPSIIKKINSYLDNHIHPTDNELRELPKGYDFDLNFSSITTRKVLANCSISFNNQHYIMSNQNNKILNLKKGTKIDIYSNYKNEHFTTYNNSKYNLIPATQENTNDLILENQKCDLRIINRDGYTVNFKKQTYHFVNQDKVAQEFKKQTEVKFYYKYSKGKYTPIIAVINKTKYSISKGYPDTTDEYNITEYTVKDNTVNINNIQYKFIDNNYNDVSIKENTKVQVEEKNKIPQTGILPTAGKFKLVSC